jgi:hypothetical protein
LPWSQRGYHAWPEDKDRDWAVARRGSPWRVNLGLHAVKRSRRVRRELILTRAGGLAPQGFSPGLVKERERNLHVASKPDLKAFVAWTSNGSDDSSRRALLLYAWPSCSDAMRSASRARLGLAPTHVPIARCLSPRIFSS